MIRRLLGACALLLLVPNAPSLAQVMRAPTTSRIQDPTEHRPNVRPRLELLSTIDRIVVDGDLSDAGWSVARVATSFSETYPGDQTLPPIGIETWMTYDEENLYLAFLIEDDPAQIRANMSDRDQIWQDDYVGMILDPYGDNAWAYFIASNAIGIQGDTRLINGGQEDVSFDVVFHSEGRITETGYQVEMAIPFRSLRFPDRNIQTWSVNFWITHPRQSRATYSWASLDRDDPCWLCQLGTVSGIEGVSPGGSIELLPALTGSQSGALRDFGDPAAGLDNDRVTAEPSLGVKYSFSSNAIADVAINPDFSQIEADAAQIDVNTTFALFFPERRPFFQEGSDLYNTRIPQVYTRSINNPSAAAKFTGRFGRSSIGYIGGLDEDTPIILPFEDRSMFARSGQSYSNIIRYRRTMGTSSFVGAQVTDRRYLDHEGAGTTLALDTRIRLSQTWSLMAELMASRTAEQHDPDLLGEADAAVTFGDGYTAAFDGESYAGYATFVRFENRSRHFVLMADYQTASPAFRTANGFLNQNSLHQSTLVGGYQFYFEDRLIERLHPHVITGYWWNYDGKRKDEFAWLGIEARFKAQTNLQARFLITSNERFRGLDFRGLRRIEADIRSNFSDPVQLAASITYGTAIARNQAVPEMGVSLNLGFGGTLRPSSRFNFQPRIDYFRLTSRATGEEFFEGYIFRSRLNYQFTRRLFLRVVTQYNDFSDRFEIDPLITYRVNPFTAIYLGSTHDFQDYRPGPSSVVDGFFQTDRQIFFKLQYLFRV